MISSFDFLLKISNIIPKNNILVENRQFVYFEKYDYKFHWNREDSVIEIYIPIK